MSPSYLEWHDEQGQPDLPDDPFPCSVQDAEARPHARVIKFIKKIRCKSIYNKHPRDLKFVAIVDRLMLFGDIFKLQKLKLGPQHSDRCRNEVVIQGWSLTHCIAAQKPTSF